MTIFELNKKNISFFLLSLLVALGTAVWGEVTLQLLILLIVAAAILAFFLKEIEISILFLLVLRSSLDFFTQLKIPAAYGVGIELLAIFYMVFCFIRNKYPLEYFFMCISLYIINLFFFWRFKKHEFFGLVVYSLDFFVKLWCCRFMCCWL